MIASSFIYFFHFFVFHISLIMDSTNVSISNVQDSLMFNKS